jgi:DNA-binding LytR/AlgR family response regulator
MKNASEIRILLVENEKEHSGLMLFHLNKIGVNQVQIASSYAEAIEIFHLFHPDVALVDIDLGEDKSGIDVASYIKSKGTTSVIFVTSNYRPDVYERAREVGPYAFMNRDFDAIKLRQVLELAVEERRSASDTAKLVAPDDSDFYVKMGSQFRKICPEDILWVEVDGRYSAIKTSDGKKTLVNSSLRDSAKKLAKAPFVRVHKSYIVNLERVESVDMHVGVIYVGEEEIPIGRNFKKDILSKIRIF